MMDPVPWVELLGRSFSQKNLEASVRLPFLLFKKNPSFPVGWLTFFSLVTAKMKPVSAAVRKRRMNFRLRKILTPKSPLMVLNEIVGGVNYTFVDTPTSMLTPGIPHLFTAQCVVRNYYVNSMFGD